MQRKYWILITITGIFPILLSTLTKNPPQTSFMGDFVPLGNIEFIYDVTYEKNSLSIHDSHIFEAQMDIIEKAEDFIVLDQFLFNDAYDKKQTSYPAQVEAMTQALIKKKQENSNIEIIFITDPINNFYGAYEEEHLLRLKENGITTVITDLDQLKDSNPLYSGYYRVFLQWFGSGKNGWIKNPIAKDSPDVTIRSFLKLLNFKANHRKVLVTEKEALISSANPHDPSANHSNVALRCSGEIQNQIIASEKAVASFSNVPLPELSAPVQEIENADTKGRLITEKSILDTLLENIHNAKQGDSIHMGIFYISNVKVLSALADASQRGVSIQIIADPNKDAFGLKKDGTPNRMALSHLVKNNETIQIRWYDTHGEQYHSKLAFFELSEENHLILGSANYTRRNIQGYNLESDLEIVTPKNSDLSQEVKQYFYTLWNNENGHYTVDFNIYQNDSLLQYWRYRIQEFIGLSTF